MVPNHWIHSLGFTFSQNGEDVILRSLFGRNYKGFFVDVGAHHPFRFSNTWLLYRMGWRGINIDPLPGAIKPFQAYRKHDINLEVGISSQQGMRVYWSFDEPAFNTFDEKIAMKRILAQEAHLLKTIPIETFPLCTILDNYIPPGIFIDLLTVDVEGMDTDVLESSDWDKYLPSVVCIEMLNTVAAEITADPAYKFLSSRGYSLNSRLKTTAIFTRKDLQFPVLCTPER